MFSLGKCSNVPFSCCWTTYRFWIWEFVISDDENVEEMPSTMTGSKSIEEGWVSQQGGLFKREECLTFVQGAKTWSSMWSSRKWHRAKGELEICEVGIRTVWLVNYFPITLGLIDDFSHDLTDNRKYLNGTIISSQGFRAFLRGRFGILSIICS